MNEIVHDFQIHAPPARVFQAVASPAGLDAWWTLRSQGAPETGATWQLDFGPGFVWTADLVTFAPEAAVAWELREADDDWRGTRVGLELELVGDATRVRFRHSGWPARNGHFRASSFCWALYLRLMKRFVETGERVPYAERNEA